MKTKIIATYGPALDGKGVLEKALRFIDVIRINMSHGDAPQWLDAKERIERAADRLGREVAFMADLPGPKIRLGALEHDVTVKKGEQINFYYVGSKKPINAPNPVPVEYDLAGYVKEGSLAFIGDGSPQLRVTGASDNAVTCVALEDGVLKSRKGLSIRDLKGGVSPPTDEDISLAEFAVKHGFDFIAESFVRKPEDVEKLRKESKFNSIIAKIETGDAVRSIDAIAREADALMVARGDLALDVGWTSFPAMQMEIIKSARKHGKPVIVATQLLASMVNSSKPTRSEPSDIAFAVYSGADALMLSDETAVGRYPVEALSVLSEAAVNFEIFQGHKKHYTLYESPGTLAAEITAAASDISSRYNLSHIFVPTQSGGTAMMLSRHRPNAEIVALSPDPGIRKSLKLHWGVSSIEISPYRSTDQMIKRISTIAERMGVKNYAILSGTPLRKGSTDTLKIVAPRYIE